MTTCLKCGKERKERGLDLLLPCSNCGVTLNEEMVIADLEVYWCSTA